MKQIPFSCSYVGSNLSFVLRKKKFAIEKSISEHLFVCPYYILTYWFIILISSFKNFLLAVHEVLLFLLLHIYWVPRQELNLNSKISRKENCDMSKSLASQLTLHALKFKNIKQCMHCTVAEYSYLSLLHLQKKKKKKKNSTRHHLFSEQNMPVTAKFRRCSVLAMNVDSFTTLA